MQNDRQKSSVVVRGLAENCQVNCLVDTGSQATLVNLSLIKHLRLEHNIRKTNCVLSSFTKDKIYTAGEITIHLTIAGTRAPHTCIVVSEDMECNILLGMDFMMSNDISILAGASKITSHHGSSPFLPPASPINKRTKVRATSTVIVPPNTVMFIKGTLDTPDKAGHDSTVYSGYLEPYENLAINDGLFAAGALTYCEKGELPVRVLNPTDDPVVIYGRKLLGFMEPAQAKDDLHEVRVQRIADSSSTTPTSTSTRIPTEWTKEKLFMDLRLEEVNIPEVDKQRLKDIVWERRTCFSTHEFDLGNCNIFEAEINLRPGAKPQYVPPIPIPYKRREAMEKHLKGMEEAGIIEETHDNTMWNSRVFLVPKPNQEGSFRFVADFRALNAECLPDQYLLPNINHVVDSIGGAKWYSTFDLSKSFYQVSYNNSSKGLTAFTANGKRYIFNKMVMGHLTSSSQFARMMDRLLANIPLDQLCYFLDDLCLASNCVKSHLDRLELILDKLMSSNMKLMPKKCEFLKSEVKFIGLTISQDGIRINEDRIKAVKEIAPPRTVKEAQQVMGFLSYNRKFVKNFAELAKPIYGLIDKRKKFVWTRACQEGFDEIKKRIAEGITLTIPQVDDPHKSYIVTMDASQDGYGAELSQRQDGERKVIAYFSKRVPQHQRPWSQMKLEFMALVEALENWAIYLKSTEFLVRTDCLSLVALERLFAKSNATMIRKLNRLAEFRFRLQHLDGEANMVSDFLSRYIHKKRVSNRSTQTDETVEQVVPAADTPRIVNCNLVMTTDSSQHDLDEEKLIPEDFFTLNNDYPTSDEADQPRDITLTEDDLIDSSRSLECICELQMRTEDDLIDRSETEVKVRTIARESSITQQLQIPTLIDLDKIKVAQKNDVILKEVRNWVEKNEKPKELQKLRLPPDLVRYWKQFNLLTMKDGVLCRKWIYHDKERNEIEIQKFLILVPEAMRETVLELHHSTLVTTHPGVDETYRQIVRQYYWPCMKAEVDLYVKSCIKCGRVKQPAAYLKAPLKHVIAHELNDALVIDHIVPQKEGTTKRGNRYILTLTDLFTGYVVAVPCKTRESEETIRIILHHWALRFGYPREIIADNDTSFTSEFFNAVLAFFNIKPTHGTVYKCSSTSKCERQNKRINTALRLTLTEKQLNDWDLYLNYVCFALNGLRSRHTGVTPNLLVFGRELITPLDLTLNGEPVVFERKSKKYGKAYELYRTVRNIVQKARKHAALDFQYADNTYNKNLKGPYFEENDWCFTLVNCPSHKFSERWQGPFRVCKKLGDHLYVIEIDNGKEKVINISKMKRYAPNKFSHDKRMNPEAPEFTPADQLTTDQTTLQSQEEPRAGCDLEVTFQPVNCRETTSLTNHDTPQVPTVTDPTVRTETVDGDWSLIERENADHGEASTMVNDQHSTVINPPNPDPTGPPEEPDRYPKRSRITRNPLQLLWGGKSYE